MRFEASIEIDAQAQRVWDVLSDLEAWPQRIDTVEEVELLTPPPLAKGSQMRLKQPKLPEGTWDITVWDTPSNFEWRQKSGGMTSVAGHSRGAVGGEALAAVIDAGHARPADPGRRSVLQEPGQPVHDPRSSGHEARIRVLQDLRAGENRRTEGAACPSDR
jgi:hypothetical protein